ncbi:hypothetical protein TNCV_2914901 [Trichonephila clavipes]|nr:hypothetical protein TNCV_2914901 [Trichonephila clavipes]
MVSRLSRTECGAGAQHEVCASTRWKICYLASWLSADPEKFVSWLRFSDRHRHHDTAPAAIRKHNINLTLSSLLCLTPPHHNNSYGWSQWNARCRRPTCATT